MFKEVGALTFKNCRPLSTPPLGVLLFLHPYTLMPFLLYRKVWSGKACIGAGSLFRVYN